MNSILQTVLPPLLVLILPAVAAGLVALLAHAGSFLKSKTASGKLRDGIDLMVHASQVVVQSLEQSVRPTLATLPDGKLTPAAAASIKSQAVNQLLSLAKAGAASGTKELLNMGESALNDYVNHLVEAQVAKLPGTAPAVPQTPPAAK